jgi:hypothetical protein
MSDSFAPDDTTLDSAARSPRLAAEPCEWIDCTNDATRTIWFGDDAGGRDLSICEDCFKKHFTE